MIDIAYLRQSYRNGDLVHLGKIRSERNIVDALTENKSQSALFNILRHHESHLKVEEWISEAIIPPKSSL